MTETQENYELMSNRCTDGRSERVVVKASEPWVFRFISRSEFDSLFGGYALVA